MLLAQDTNQMDGQIGCHHLLREFGHRAPF